MCNNCDTARQALLADEQSMREAYLALNEAGRAYEEAYRVWGEADRAYSSSLASHQ